jgi:predicted kinase
MFGMVPTPALIIMCGLPYSGKSILAKKIAEQRKYALIAYDTLWNEIAREQGKSPDGDLVLDIANERVKANLTKGMTTVYDTLHTRRDWWDRVVSIATACGARHRIVYLKTPPETIMERYRANSQTGARHQIALAVLQGEIDKCEPPEPPESFVEFSPQDDLDEWVRAFII